MSEHSAQILWSRGDRSFLDDGYSRGHEWILDGGIRVPASAAPGIPHSVAAAIDPEEGVLASLASCHMLFFLALAMRKGFVVDEYVDAPRGVIARNENGKNALVEITMSPRAEFSGNTLPSKEDVEALHNKAHGLCYVANSLNSKIVIEPQFQ
jgi:organic hydroperoxide reductase OsmC/OhrA